MNGLKLSISTVWQAIEGYLQFAYPDGKVPSAVRNRLETLRACSDDAFFDCPVFERDRARTNRLLLRLGNRFYPHMKLVIERAPDGCGHLFEADTHDQHIRPAPGSREYRAFCELMQSNEGVAKAIEEEWARRGVPTFKQFLRQDIERRIAIEPPPAQRPSPTS